MNVLETKTEPVAQRVATGLSKIGLALRSRAWKEAGVKRLMPLQAQTLSVLRIQPKQTATVSAIAEELAVRLPTASEVIRTLAERGLVKRTRSQADGRSVSVSLTAKGRRKAEAASSWPEFLAAAAQTLPADEQVMLLRTLVKMIYNLQAQGDIPTARMCVTCRFFRPHVHADAERPHHCDFVNAPFGDRLIRIECGEHAAADPRVREHNWAAFDRKPTA
ncbi:MarR family winged helix-turn-helix transcriptional regulator [Candidatus Nitrospira bockiana]